MKHNATKTRASASRVANFTDAVFAIVMTLLVIDIRVPPAETVAQLGLPRAVLEDWTSLAAYALSFLKLAGSLTSHHLMFRYVKESTHILLLLTSLMLLFIGLVPFSTALLADFVRGTPDEARFATLVYCAVHALEAIFFNVAWHYAIRAKLLGNDIKPSFIRRLNRYWLIAPTAYLTAFFLAFVSVPASLGLLVVLLFLYVIPVPVNSPTEQDTA